MTDMPDLVIPYEAEYPHVLGEFPKSYGPYLTETHIVDSSAAKVWRFQTREALHMFAAALVRDYRREGTAVARSHSSEYEHCYDSRSEMNAPNYIGHGNPLYW